MPVPCRLIQRFAVFAAGFIDRAGRNFLGTVFRLAPLFDTLFDVLVLTFAFIAPCFSWHDVLPLLGGESRFDPRVRSQETLGARRLDPGHPDFPKSQVTGRDGN